MFKQRSFLAAVDKRVEARLRPFVDYLEKRAIFTVITIFAAVFGFIVLIATAFQIGSDISDRRIAEGLRKEEQQARAWERLLSPAAGNTGKGEALTYLVNNGKNIDGVDLSCRHLGNWDQGTCQKPAIFSDVNISRSDNLTGVRYDPGWAIFAMRDLDLSWAEFVNMSISHFAIESTDFSHTRVRSLTTKLAKLQGEFDGAEFTDCALIATTIRPTGSPPRLERCDVSSATLPWLAAPSPDRHLYAWADRPPSQNGGLMDFSTDDVRHVLLVKRDSKLPLEAFEHITLCEPPLTQAGNPTDAMDRKPLRGQDLINRCKVISVAEAKVRFPDLY